MSSAVHPFHPVVLSGGTGSRLWPLSRASLPKQLLNLADPDKSMLQATVARAMALKGAQAPTVVSNEGHRFMIQEQLIELGHADATIILEPAARNTAPAIALAALHLQKTDPKALMLVLPADHVVDAGAAFEAAISAALEASRAGNLLTFGVVPTEAATGYGYIEAGADLGGGCQKVTRFVEKPDGKTAQSMLASGNYLWNSGMFVLRADVYLDELKAHRPDIWQAAVDAMQAPTLDLGFLRPQAAAFEACPSESIDYAVMQVTQKAAVVRAGFAWSDIGSWASLWDIGNKDAQGNVLLGDVFASDTRNSYIRAESKLLAVIGLDDVVVVETADAVLVMRKDKSQDIKSAVEHFGKTGRKEHLEHVRMYRPWGWYEGIDAGERFQVKRIMVKPGSQLSLQMHHHRAEHWIVVSGTARVTVGEEVVLLSENQSTYIPLGEVHRLENPGKLPLHLIEVQSGSYLGEDDIVRFEDNYGRSS